MIGHRAPATLVRLEKKLANDPCAILTAAEIRLLDREVRRVLVLKGGGLLNGHPPLAHPRISSQILPFL